MEESSGSSASVVPSGGGLPSVGSQAPSESALLTTASIAGEDKLDPIEAGFREEMSKMLTSEAAAGSAQQGKPAVRHSRGADWIMGIPGMRILFQRSKLEEMPIAVKDGALWLPSDASVYGADVGLEAIGLKPFVERDMEEEKLKKALPTVPLLRARGVGVDWESWFEKFESAVINKGVRLERWIDVLLVHTSAEMEPVLQGHIDVCTQKGIAPRDLYACVRDDLLNSDVAYSPMSYLSALMPAQEFSQKPKELAQTMRKLARNYELARRRAAFRSLRFPELSNYFVAHLFYLRLDPVVRAQVPAPELVRLTGGLPFQAVSAAAGNMEDTGRLQAALAAAAAVVTPPSATGLVAAVTERAAESSGGNQRGGARKRERRGRSPARSQERGKPKKPRKPRPGASREEQARCYFCGSRDHRVSACTKWREWLAEDPRKRGKLCAKCQVGTHPARYCRAEKGKLWPVEATTVGLVMWPERLSPSTPRASERCSSPPLEGAPKGPSGVAGTEEERRAAVKQLAPSKPPSPAPTEREEGQLSEESKHQAMTSGSPKQMEETPAQWAAACKAYRERLLQRLAQRKPEAKAPAPEGPAPELPETAGAGGKAQEMGAEVPQEAQAQIGPELTGEEPKELEHPLEAPRLATEEPKEVEQREETADRPSPVLHDIWASPIGSPQRRDSGLLCGEQGAVIYHTPMVAEEKEHEAASSQAGPQVERAVLTAPTEESADKAQKVPAAVPPPEEERRAREQATPQEQLLRRPEPITEEPSGGEGTGDDESQKSPQVVLTPHTSEEAREPQGSPPGGPKDPSKSPSPVRRRGDKGIAESSPEETGTEAPKRRLRKPLLKPLELLGPERLEARAVSLMKHRQEAKEAQQAKTPAATPRGRRKQITPRPVEGLAPKSATIPKFAVPGLIRKPARPSEAAPPAPSATKTRQPQVIDITGEGDKAEKPAAKRRVPTPETIRRSRKLATELAFDFLDVAEVNPYFQKQLGVGINQAGRRYLDPHDLREYERERAEYIQRAKRVDEQQKEAGFPAQGVNEVLMAYALIPQEATWVPESPAIPELECEGRSCVHHTTYAQLRCPKFKHGWKRAVMKFCERWKFIMKDRKEWLVAPPSLFDLDLSYKFRTETLTRQKQSLVAQAAADVRAYGISDAFLDRERDRCVQLLVGEITRQEFRRYAKRARWWRLRKFAPEEYKKLQAKRSKRLRQRAGRGLPVEPKRTDMDWELDELESGRSLSPGEDSSSDEEASMEREPETTDVPRKVCAVVAMVSAGLSTGEHVYVPVIYGMHRYRGMMDTGSTITILNGVRFIPTRFVGYEPTPENEIMVQSVSGQLLSFMGKCNVLLTAAPNAGRIEVWFARQLPIDAILGTNVVNALSLTMYPPGDIGDVALKTRDGLKRLETITISSLHLCAMVRSHQAPHWRELPQMSIAQRDDLGDPYACLYRRLEKDTGPYMHGYVPEGCCVPASLDITFGSSPLCCLAKRPDSETDDLLAADDGQPGTYIQQLIDKLCMSANVPDEYQSKLKSLCHKYSDIFNDGTRPLAKTNLTRFVVELSEQKRPLSCAPRMVSHAKREEIKKIVEQGMSEGIIVPSVSEWASAVVLVRKPDGSPRLCIDYRPLNKILKVPNYPLPRISQALEVLEGKKYFSVFDLVKAYWQVEVDPASRKYLAFITPDGLYEWTRMPFGVAAAPATQQRMVDRLLAGLKWCCAIAYLDDIVIFSNTFEEHLAHLEALFMRCRKANLQLHPGKSALCQRETKYLGFIVSAEGVRPDPAKTAPISQFPRPTDKKAVRRFLGIGSYYRRFIKGFARVAQPLQKLVPENATFLWGDEQERAFQELKAALTAPTFMAHPRPGLPYVVDCDAAMEGLGAVLSQKVDGHERPICYASRVLRPNEKKWSVTELEAFAVVWALETFRVYVEGSPTLVRTDHSPLLWLRNNAGKSARIARWVLRLQDFAFDLQHRAGRCNLVADALSRYPVGDKEPPEHPTMFQAPLCAFVAQAQRCQACWGQTLPFLTRGGGGEIENGTSELRERAKRALEREGNPVNAQERQKPLPPGAESIKEAQAVCPECIALVQYINNVPGAELPAWVQRAGLKPVLRDGVLCLASWKTNGGEERPDRIFVPTHLRVPLVQRVHAERYAGHMGKKKTLAKLRLRYLWGTMTADVDKVTKTCVQCWQYARGGPREIPMRTLPRGWPGEVVAMDLFGPLPRTARGATVILVMIDHFTRWAEPVALRKAEVSDVVACLLEVWMPRHGVPAILLSDNGPQFVAAVLKDFCASTGVRKMYSTPYHPQGNSVVESYMRTLKKGLAALVSEDGKDWDLFLPAVALAHNSTPHVATGFSPFFLTYGREAVLPVQRHLDEPRLDPTSGRWLTRLWKSRVLAYEAQAEIEKRRREVAQKTDTPLPTGTLVMLRLTPQEKAAYPSKFVPMYKGPWVIAERFPNGKTYRVRDLGSEEERQLTRDQFKVVDLPPENRITPEPAIPQEAALRDLREEGDQEEEEPLVWLGNSSPSELSENEGAEAPLIEEVPRAPKPPPPQRRHKYTLRPRAERDPK